MCKYYKFVVISHQKCLHNIKRAQIWTKSSYVVFNLRSITGIQAFFHTKFNVIISIDVSVLKNHEYSADSNPAVEPPLNCLPRAGVCKADAHLDERAMLDILLLV